MAELHNRNLKMFHKAGLLSEEEIKIDSLDKVSFLAKDGAGDIAKGEGKPSSTAFTSKESSKLLKGLKSSGDQNIIDWFNEVTTTAASLLEKLTVSDDEPDTEESEE